MSGLLDQAGLTAGSGLTNGAGLYKWGNFNPFDPTDLDPYLLFDTGAGSMIGTLENPTLDLDPSNQETLDVITATRSSVATRTLPDGTIALAEQDTVRVDYTQGAELTPTKFQHIENTDFSTGWFPSNITISTNQAIAPDGSQTAIKLVQNNVTNSQFYTRDLISGGDNTYTYSLYAKQADAGKHLYFELGNARASVNLNDGSIYYGPNTFSSGWSNPSVSVVALDDGWYRVAMTATASSSVSSFYAKNHVSILSGSGDGIINDGDGTSGIYLWGPQLEEGTTASSFVANTTGSPKFITGATYGPRVAMILVEPSATNLVTYSEDFSQSFWTKNNITLSSGFTAPDGSMNASKLVATSDNGSISNVFTVASGTTYSLSFYLKTISGSLETTIGLGSPGFPQNVGDGGRYKNITVTDEWQRFTLTSTADASADTGVSFGGFNGFSTGEEVYIWGAQLETGSVSTSYIPTSGGDAAARTRADDLLSITGSAFSDFFNGSEGTFYIEAVDRQATGSGHSYIIGQGLSQYFLYANENTTVALSFDGANMLDIEGLTSNQLFRAAVSYKTGVSPAPSVKSLSFNGTSEVDQPYSGNFAATNILKIGHGYTDVFSGHFRRILFWPTHSSRL
tara:strand:+ start:358 stop:2232 length:1875 start_codon:yes stop_codon:yes gene_type:complete